MHPKAKDQSENPSGNSTEDTRQNPALLSDNGDFVGVYLKQLEKEAEGQRPIQESFRRIELSMAN